MISLGHEGAPKSAMWLSLVLLGAALLSACATLSKSECKTADWQTIGFEDGAGGATAAKIGKHREACAKHGVTPDLAAYNRGREQGLREYCRTQNGFRLGEQGAVYRGVCPADLEPDFQTAYEAGKVVYHAASAVRHTQSRIRSNEQKLARLKLSRQARQAELVSPDVSTARRVELMAEIFELARDQGAVEKEIEALKIDLVSQREELAQVRANSPYR